MPERRCRFHTRRWWRKRNRFLKSNRIRRMLRWRCVGFLEREVHSTGRTPNRRSTYNTCRRQRDERQLRDNKRRGTAEARRKQRPVPLPFRNNESRKNIHTAVISNGSGGNRHHDAHYGTLFQSSSGHDTDRCHCRSTAANSHGLHIRRNAQSGGLPCPSADNVGRQPVTQQSYGMRTGKRLRHPPSRT